jgi:hypothetical protein
VILHKEYIARANEKAAAHSQAAWAATAAINASHAMTSTSALAD